MSQDFVVFISENYKLQWEQIKTFIF